MDRNLRIRMLLEAADKVTKPLRNIAQGSSRTAQALKATRDRLKEIERAQADVAGFRQLKTGLRSTETELSAAQTRVAELARAMAAAETPTKKLAADFAKAKREAATLKTEHAAQSAELQTVRERMNAAGAATAGLVGHERNLRTAAARTNQELAEQERRLTEVNGRASRFAAGREAFDKMQGRAANMAIGGAASIGTGMSMARPMIAGVKEAQAFQSGMTDIAQKANMTRAAAEKMGAGLLVASRAANQMPAALQEGVDALAGFGLDPAKAAAMMKPIGRAATAYKAEIQDLSRAAFAVNDNLKVPIEQTGRVIDVMATAGKAGAFEIKDMAQYFPALTAGYQALGQKGVPAVADLAAALQIARKGAGDAASAATNVENVIQKMASPTTIKKFAKFGIDLPNALKKAYADGKTPLEAIAELTNKALGGDLSKIGFLFEDMQVQQGLRPLIQNLQEYRRIRAEAGGARGTADRDFAGRMKDSAEQSKRLAVNARTLGIVMGTQLLPFVNAVTSKLNDFASWLGAAAQKHPLLTKVTIISAAAIAALFVVLGGAAIAVAAIMGPIAIMNAGLIAMGVAGGIASIGLLPIIGTVAAVVAGVALLGAAAYLIYNNWSAITGFFSGIWSGVKAIFAGGLSGILQSILYLDGYVIGALINLGSRAFSWLTTQLPSLLSSGFATAWRAFKAAMQFAFFELPAMFVNLGSMIVQGIVNGIKGAPGALWRAAKGLANSMSDGFKAGAGIHSPSRVFMRLGGYIVEGLTNGIADEEHAPVRRLDGLSRRMAAAIAIGTAAPAFAVAGNAATAGAGSHGQVGARAGSGVHYEVHIHAAPGQDEKKLADLFERKIIELERRHAAARRSSFADTPDWNDA